MIAHSFRGDVFGPAQRLHGATPQPGQHAAIDGASYIAVGVHSGATHDRDRNQAVRITRPVGLTLNEWKRIVG